jgi:hypothetical protein
MSGAFRQPTRGFEARAPFMASYGFSSTDVLARVAGGHCAQMVNPKYTHVTKVAKRFLPESR